MACVHIFEMTSPEIDKRNQKNEKMGLNKAQISIVLGATFTECPHCNFDIYHFADHWQKKYSILKTIKMARFAIGRLKVFKQLTYLFMIIIIGIAYTTSYKSM